MGNREAISAGLRFEVFRRCNFACYYCGVPAALGIKVLHVDHVIPVDLGGTNDPWNLVAACWDCNGGKTNTMPPAWLVRQVRNDCESLDLGDGESFSICLVCTLPFVSTPDMHGYCEPCMDRDMRLYNRGKLNALTGERP